MALIADLLLLAGACAAAFYCFVLSRRLRRFTDLEKGVGGAIAVLSAQIDDLSQALKHAEGASRHAAENLEGKCAKADDLAGRLELLIASLHDLPEPRRATPSINPFFVRPDEKELEGQTR